MLRSASLSLLFHLVCLYVFMSLPAKERVLYAVSFLTYCFVIYELSSHPLIQVKPSRWLSMLLPMLKKTKTPTTCWLPLSGGLFHPSKIPLQWENPTRPVVSKSYHHLALATHERPLLSSGFISNTSHMDNQSHPHSPFSK